MLSIQNAEEIPINVVGSSVFGRYPKISEERTYNAFISDGWAVNYSGYQKRVTVSATEKGRGIFRSVRGGFDLAVIGSGVYRLNASLGYQLVGTLRSNAGEVFMDENLSRQICIVDGSKAYIYAYSVGGLSLGVTEQTLSNGSLVSEFSPGYVAYHNTFFLLASVKNDTNPQRWYAASRATDTTISIADANLFALQTKPDSALAIKRLPGKGNNVIVIGSVVAEVWTQVGGTENYRRNASFNIDSGTVSVNTIAASEEYVCWLAQNENNAPYILATNGGATKRISTDGIDFLLQSIIEPEKSTAFFYRQDGHLFYQLVFYGEEDNVSLIHDFNTEKFFHVSDERLNYYPARQVIYANEQTYFVSINDGCIYQMGTQFVEYNYTVGGLPGTGEEIPRIRVCKTARQEDGSRFRLGRFFFWIEQGTDPVYRINTGGDDICTQQMITEDDNPIVTESGVRIQAEDGICVPNANNGLASANGLPPCVDLTISKNGNQSFSNAVRKNLNPVGRYANMVSWDRMGQANECTIQLRFYGIQRYCANNGTLEIY